MITLFAQAGLSLISISLLIIGTVALLFPVKSSTFFGIETDSKASVSFVRAMAARDIGIAGIGAYLGFTVPASENAWFVAMVALFSGSDAAITYFGNSPKWILHLLATIVLVIFALFLWQFA